MSSLNGIDLEDILRLNALSESSEFDDDDDENVAFLSDEDDDDDDETLFADDDDDDDEEGFFSDDIDDYESADQDEEFPDRRRRRRRWARRRYRRVAPRRRIRLVRGSKSTILRSPNGQRMRVRFGKSFATRTEVNKLIRSTEKKFADAMKERKANFNRLSKQISSSAKAIDGRVSSVSKKVKKLEEQAKSNALLGMLGGSPKVKTITFEQPEDGKFEPGKELKANVQFEKQDLLLPLLLSGGLGGSGGSGDNSLLLALALQK